LHDLSGDVRGEMPAGQHRRRGEFGARLELVDQQFDVAGRARGRDLGDRDRDPCRQGGTSPQCGEPIDEVSRGEAGSGRVHVDCDRRQVGAVAGHQGRHPRGLAVAPPAEPAQSDDRGVRIDRADGPHILVDERGVLVGRRSEVLDTGPTGPGNSEVLPERGLVADLPVRRPEAEACLRVVHDRERLRCVVNLSGQGDDRFAGDRSTPAHELGERALWSGGGAGVVVDPSSVAVREGVEPVSESAARPAEEVHTGRVEHRGRRRREYVVRAQVDSQEAGVKRHDGTVGSAEGRRLRRKAGPGRRGGGCGGVGSPHERDPDRRSEHHREDEPHEARRPGSTAPSPSDRSSCPHRWSRPVVRATGSC